MEVARELWQKEGIRKEFKISFPGTNIADITNERIYNRSGIELVRGVCDDDDIVFGKCNSDCFSVMVDNLEEDVVGKEMVASVTCAGEELTLGKFIVNKAPRRTQENYKKIVAYDRMQRLNVNMASWYNAVLPNADSTVTLKYFRDSFFAYLGLEQTEVTLINDDLVVRKTVDTNEISGIEIMQAVCEINGVFGHFTPDGKFDYISLGENEETVVGAITADYEEYMVHPINRVQLRQEDGDIGYITAETSEKENAYIVTGNFLLYGMTNDELKVVGDRLLAKIQGITYVPATQELKGIPDARLGSSYRVETSDGSSVTSIILKHMLKGGQALRSTFEAVGNEYREEDIDGLSYQFKQLKGRYNKLSRTVDETVAELGTMDAELGEVSTIARQTASYFESEVTQEGEVLSRFTQELGKFLFEGGNFAIITDNITIDGNVLTIGNGYIGGIKIGSEGLSSEDYTTLQIFRDGTGKFTNLYGNGKGNIYLKPVKAEDDDDPVVPYLKTQDGFHADYDSVANKSANMHCDSAGYAHYGLVSGDMESSDEAADIEMVLKPDGAYIQSGDGMLKNLYAANMGGGGSGSGMNYSTEEQVVGTWVDGQPVYQKTMWHEDPIANDTLYFDTGIIWGVFKTLIQCYGSLYDSVNNAYLPLPYVSRYYANYQLQVELRNVNDHVQIFLAIDSTAYTEVNRLGNANVTIRYLKHQYDSLIYRNGVLYKGGELYRSYTWSFAAEYDLTSYDYLYFCNTQYANSDATYGCKEKFFLDKKYKYCVFKTNTPLYCTEANNNTKRIGLYIDANITRAGDCGMTDGEYYYAVRRFSDDVLDTDITFSWYMWWPNYNQNVEIRIYEIYLTNEPPTGMEMYESVG